MASERLAEEWRALSSSWIQEARAGRNSNRSGLLDEVMLEACGNTMGVSVLDCGCGEGRFCRMLVERGAKHALGIDLCEPMIRAARELQSPHDEYRVADAQDLSFIEDATFDLAVSYLNQCDLPDVDSNNREVYRVLRPQGRFVVANVHPMRSAVGGWHKDSAGDKQHVILDRYFDETERCWTIMGVELTNFHRSLSTCVNGYLATGFRLVALREPSVTAERLLQFPELADEQRVPNFIVYVLQKP